MPIKIIQHSGGCCGICCMFSLNHITAEDKTRIRDILSEASRCNVAYTNSKGDKIYPSTLVEAVLNGPQRVRNKSHEFLISVGFRLVTTFINVNTGNSVHVYHWCRFDDTHTVVDSDGETS